MQSSRLWARGVHRLALGSSVVSLTRATSSKATDDVEELVSNLKQAPSRFRSMPKPQQQPTSAPAKQEAPSATTPASTPTPASSVSHLKAAKQEAPSATTPASTPTPASSVSHLKAQIDKVTRELRQALDELAKLRSKPGANGLTSKQIRSTAEPESVFEALTESDLNSSFTPQLTQPLVGQEILVDSVSDAVRDVPIIATQVRHVALATVVGRVTSAASHARDEENSADVVSFTVSVTHPLIRDTSHPMEFEVRSYSMPLSNFCSRQLHQGDMVHILGHVLPDSTNTRTVIVLVDEGCHVSVILGHEGLPNK